MKIEKLTNALLGICAILLLLYPSYIVVVFAGQDDSNNSEVGIEWVNDYPGFINDLMWCDADAEGFYNHLGSKGFTRVFDRGDNLAWESDFERQGVGGSDFVDINCDFAYFSGHGTEEAFLFGTNHDGDGNYVFKVQSLEGSSINQEAQWGDRDLEWIFISACLVLNWQNIASRWSYAFSGDLHGMTGFSTEEDQTPVLGEYFAKYLADTWGPYNIKDAWKNATRNDPNINNAREAAIYRVKLYLIDLNQYVDYGTEHLPGYGSGMIMDPQALITQIRLSGLRVSYNIYYDKWSCGS